MILLSNGGQKLCFHVQTLQVRALLKDMAENESSAKAYQPLVHIKTQGTFNVNDCIMLTFLVASHALSKLFNSSNLDQVSVRKLVSIFYESHKSEHHKLTLKEVEDYIIFLTFKLLPSQNEEATLRRNLKLRPDPTVVLHETHDILYRLCTNDFTINEKRSLEDLGLSISFTKNGRLDLIVINLIISDLVRLTASKSIAFMRSKSETGVEIDLDAVPKIEHKVVEDQDEALSDLTVTFLIVLGIVIFIIILGSV